MFLCQQSQHSIPNRIHSSLLLVLIPADCLPKSKAKTILPVQVTNIVAKEVCICIIAVYSYYRQVGTIVEYRSRIEGRIRLCIKQKSGDETTNPALCVKQEEVKVMIMDGSHVRIINILNIFLRLYKYSKYIFRLLFFKNMFY